jgi:transcriptional regulator with XRE-family HTH domain
MSWRRLGTRDWQFGEECGDGELEIWWGMRTVVLLNLKQLRLSAGITQQRLAEMLDVTHATIQRWENGLRDMPSSKVIQVAAALGCHPGELFNPTPQAAARVLTKLSDGIMGRDWKSRKLGTSPTMLRKLIREALEQSGLTMAEASRRAGQSPQYLKAFMRENSPLKNPGIKTILSIGMVLGIRPQDIAEAAMADLVNEGSGPKTLQALTQLSRDLSPAELQELFSQVLEIKKRRTGKDARGRKD